MKNLQGLNIRSVSATGEILLDEAGHRRLSEALREYKHNRRRGSLERDAFYEVDAVRHLVALEVELDNGNRPGIAGFTLDAYPSPTRSRPRASTRERQARQLSEIEAILSDIGGLNLDSRLHAHVAWRFQPDSKKTIIDLPMITIQNSNLPFTEISGVRFRKVTEEDVTTVTIDLMRDRSLLVTLVSPLPGVTISVDMMDHVVQQSARIIGDFVFDIDIQFEDRRDDL